MIQIVFSSTKKESLQLICSADELELIRYNFSIPNPAYISKRKYIPSRLYAITPTGKFEIGFLREIEKYLLSENINYYIDDDIGSFWCKNEIQGDLDCLSLQYREYQETAIRNSIENGRGLILVGTGGGKTLLTAGLIINFRKFLNKPNAKVLITVPTIQLVEQTAADFIEYGLNNVSKWSGKNKLNHDATIIVAGTQYLVGKNTDLSVLNDIDLYIGDEIHCLKKNNELNNIFKFLKTPYRFGLTGSLPSEKIDQWNMIGKIGPILFEKKTDNLKKEKYVSDFNVVIINIDHGKKTFSFNSMSPTSKYENELNYLINDTKRNDIIAKLANKINKNTIIMVERILHGEEILKCLQKFYPEKTFYFIQGSTELDERENIRKIMEEKSDVIVIAISKIFSTGINIPNLHCVIFASAGKAKVKIIQSIGRALRLHPTKEKALIIDIADNTHYGQLHKKERITLYKNEKYEYLEKDI